jgi:Leucine-rich repeat (LRR) protein
MRRLLKMFRFFVLAACIGLACGCKPSQPKVAASRGATTRESAPLPAALQRLAEDGASVQSVARLKFEGTSGPSIRFEKKDIPAEVAIHLRDVEGHVYLYFNACRFSRGALKALNGMRNLVALNIGDSTGDTDLLSEVDSLPGLEGLSLQRCNVSAPGLALLRSAKHLKRLTLVGREFDDRALALLADHDSLISLHITSPAITDDGLRHLSQLTGIKELWLSECPITDAGLRHLARLERLESLLLDRTRITGTAFTQLHSLGHLEMLGVSHAPVTDAGLSAISTLRGLKTLFLNYTAITDDGVGQLARLPSLQVLFITGTSITDAGLARLPRSCDWGIDATGTKVTAAAHKVLPKARISVGPDKSGGN